MPTINSLWNFIIKRLPIIIALIVQLIIFFTLLIINKIILIPIFIFIIIQAILAALITAALPIANWWIIFQALFPLALILGLTFPIPNFIWLGAFIILWLVESNAVRERVPLYLSGDAACQALHSLLPNTPFKFIDLGCGTGQLLANLATLHPQASFVGIESAPLPWIIARLNLTNYTNCQLHWGNFWKVSLNEYDVVYCFLSPEPMEKLWIKACNELSSGALLISNNFSIPNAPPPTQILTLSDFKGPLYVWLI